LFTGSASPYVHGYAWSNSTGFGTKFSNPASLTGSGSYGLSLDPNNTNIAIGVDADPRLAAYPWSNTTVFGTRYSDPSGTTGLGSGVTFVFGQLGQPVVLRGIAQSIAVNLLGLTVSGAQLNCTFEWTEE
jgi:hypothetical protein